MQEEWVLFNKDYFYSRQRAIPEFETALVQMTMLMLPLAEADRLMGWQEGIESLHANIRTPPIDGPGSSAPEGISDLLNTLLRGLTAFDFQERIDSYDSIQSSIQRFIKILETELKRKVRLQRRQKIREASEIKIKKQQDRLAMALAEGRQICRTH